MAAPSASGAKTSRPVVPSLPPIGRDMTGSQSARVHKPHAPSTPRMPGTWQPSAAARRSVPSLGFTWRFLREADDPIKSVRKQMVTPRRDSPYTQSQRRALESANATRADEMQSQLQHFLEELQNRKRMQEEKTAESPASPQEKDTDKFLKAVEEQHDDEKTRNEIGARTAPSLSQPPVGQTLAPPPDDDAEDTYVENGAPCIIWHSSNRVRLATNLPAELKGKAVSQLATGPIPDLWNDDFLPVQKKSSVLPMNTLRARSQKYGAWYLPVTQWRMPGENGERFVGRDQKDKTDADLESLVQEMESEIVKLYSSRMFRAFVKKQNYRMPHYLQRMDSP